MLECEKTEIKCEKINHLHFVWNTIKKIGVGQFVFHYTIIVLVRILGDLLPKYGSFIIKSFLGIALATIFGVNTLS